MFIVTGGAGFIGSAILRKLNEKGVDNILVVDDLESSEKWKNLRNASFKDYVHKDRFLEIVTTGKLPGSHVEAIIHMGACSSTTERDAEYMMNTNYQYTKTIAEFAASNGARFIYASSAATYGDGSEGFDDNQQEARKLRPLNIYGYSKQLFDIWALQTGLLNRITGIKFFNVFGPNEYHKDDMSSVIYKAYHQIKNSGKLDLFKSYRPEYKDGEQLRDFVYIKDCTEIIWKLVEHTEAVGIYNLGTGKARSWNDLAKAVFSAMGKPLNINYIEMPESIRDRYQYFTQANMAKLEKLNLGTSFMSLEDSVKDYVQNYLMKNAYL